MGPIVPEPASPRSRRQAFIATCSPDELLGQVIQALGPNYNIDAPHLLALRNVLSSAIVAPRKPPQLKRTRPDKRIGEIGSIHDTPLRSSHGPNGPPKSDNQSFYFHHKDTDFKKLLPQVDCSRYERIEEPTRQEASDCQANPDDAKRVQYKVPVVGRSSEKHIDVPATAPAIAPTRADHKKTDFDGPTQRLEETRRVKVPSVQDSDLIFDPLSTLSVLQRATPTTGPASLDILPTPLIPTVATTSSEYTQTKAVCRPESTPLLASLIHAADIAIELADTQDTPAVLEPFSHSLHHVVQYSSTQDTLNSTQQSEVFSPPADFIHYTPPTQDELPKLATTEAKTLSAMEDTTTRSKNVNATAQDQPLHGFGSSSPQSSDSVSSSNKRVRGMPEPSEGTQQPKRSRLARGTLL